MSIGSPRPSCDDVIAAFAMEGDVGVDTLARYLREYPEHAEELLDMSRELARIQPLSETELSPGESAIAEIAWHRHRTALPVEGADPFAVLTTPDLRRVANAVGLPRQVLTALRERRVIPASVTSRFLSDLAVAMGSSLEALRGWIETAAPAPTARAYMSEDKPQVRDKVSFERILVDAGVPPEKRGALLADDA